MRILFIILTIFTINWSYSHSQDFNKYYVICRPLVDDSLIDEIIPDSIWIIKEHKFGFLFDTIKIESIVIDKNSQKTISAYDTSIYNYGDTVYKVFDKDYKYFNVYKEQIFNDINETLNGNIMIKLSETLGGLRIEPHSWISKSNSFNDLQKKILMQHYMWINGLKKTLGFTDRLFLDVYLNKNNGQRLLYYLIINKSSR